MWNIVYDKFLDRFKIIRDKITVDELCNFHTTIINYKFEILHYINFFVKNAFIFDDRIAGI